MQEIFILPPTYMIRDHAVQRFLERVMNKESYTQEEKEIATEIIRNILSNRVLKQRKIDQYQMQLIYRNAVFVYDKSTNSIITVYPDEKSKKKVEWAYIFPAPLHIKKGMPADQIPLLVTYGFIPIKKEKRFIIGQLGQQLFRYDPRNNTISHLKICSKAEE